MPGERRGRLLRSRSLEDLAELPGEAPERLVVVPLERHPDEMVGKEENGHVGQGLPHAEADDVGSRDSVLQDLVGSQLEIAAARNLRSLMAEILADEAMKAARDHRSRWMEVKDEQVDPRLQEAHALLDEMLRSQSRVLVAG